jgi:hypothetical protein
MTRRIHAARLVPLALAGLVAAGPAPVAEAGTLRAGAASVAITPPPGTPLAGYYSPRAADGVHDDLHAKALVVEVDGRRAALVALDLISTNRDLVVEARKRIEAATDVPGDAAMISATHTHTGPLLYSATQRDVALGGSSDLARAYMESLPGKIAEAVRQAEAKLAPARLKVAHGEESSIAFNRRFHMTDGSVGWNPGKLNPKILKAAGPIDPDVPFAVFEAAEGDDAGKVLAVYVNYAVHLDNVGGARISADMPATLARSIALFAGDDAVTLWTAGCCGDVNHIDVAWPAPQHGHENAARMGVILAGAVLRAWPTLRAVEVDSLGVASTIAELPLPEITPEAVTEAESVARRHGEGSTPAPSFLETVNAYKVLDVSDREGKPQQVEVQVITLGDQLAWVSLPGEIFVELGLAIKQDSPFPNTIVAELANGAIGYIPTRRAYTQGNYEVVSARCAAGSGEILVDTAVRMLKSLYAEAHPTAP